MYVVPNLFKYINFTFNLIEIEEDNIIDYAVSYDYNYISFIDIVNDVVKNDYNNIFADPNLFKNFGGFDNKTEK